MWSLLSKWPKQREKIKKLKKINWENKWWKNDLNKKWVTDSIQCQISKFDFCRMEVMIKNKKIVSMKRQLCTYAPALVIEIVCCSIASWIDVRSCTYVKAYAMYVSTGARRNRRGGKDIQRWRGAYLFVHFIELIDQTNTLVGQNLQERKNWNSLFLKLRQALVEVLHGSMGNS